MPLQTSSPTTAVPQQTLINQPHHAASTHTPTPGIQVRFEPKQQGGLEEGRLELEIMSEQRWVLPTLLVLVRWVFGDALEVRVTSVLQIDPRTGKVVAQVRRGAVTHLVAFGKGSHRAP